MLRDEASHKQHCALLEDDDTGEISKQYGINRNSILNEHVAQLHVFQPCLKFVEGEISLCIDHEL